MNQIKTDRTVIRSFQKSDFPELRELMSDPDIMKHTGFRTIKTESETREHLEDLIQKVQWPLGVWASVTKSGELIGWFMLKVTDEDAPEIGFMVRKKYWHRGYATEISIGILNYAFNDLKRKRVIARCDEGNLNSKKVLRKVGMNLIKTASGVCFFEKNKA